MATLSPAIYGRYRIYPPSGCGVCIYVAYATSVCASLGVPMM